VVLGLLCLALLGASPAPAAAASGAAAAAPLKVAVMPLASVEGVPGKTAEALTEAVCAEVRKRSGAQVITQREISTILSLEQQKAMLGCQNDACFAEIGGALGVQRMVSGDLSRLGESWLFHLKLLDPDKAQVLANSDRRLRGGTIDDVLDALPAMVAELFPAPARQPPVASSESEASAAATPPGGRAVTGAPVTPAAVKLPPSVAPGAPRAEPPPPRTEEPEALQEPLPPPTAPMPGRTPAREVLPAFHERSIPVPLRLRSDMKVYGDGNGRFLALAPFGGQGQPVFFGKPKKLFRQEVLTRRELDTTGYEVVVWEPRVAGGRAVISVHGEEARVRCGDLETTLPALPRRQGETLLLGATYYAPPFVRAPVGLARDDDGNFFFIDAARGPEERGPEGRAEARGRSEHAPDYRLYAGPSGALTRQEIENISAEGQALVMRTARGRLRLQREGSSARADWLAEGGRRMLVWLDPAKYQQLIFGELGVYGGQPMGTVCDPLLQPK